MAETTRLLAAFPCRSCGATLLIARPEDRELPCPLCGEPAKAPKRLVEDLELGKKMPFDAPAEVQQAVDGYVEAAHVGPEAPGWALMALALAAGGLGAWAYASSVLRPALGDWAFGAGLGLVMVMLPFGFTLQWLATSELARKVDRATAFVKHRSLTCSRCQNPVMPPPAPGRFDCVECKASLVAAGGLVIVDETPRSSRWKEAVAGALKGEGWLNRGGIRVAHRWMVVVVVFACLTAVYFTLHST